MDNPNSKGKGKGKAAKATSQAKDGASQLRELSREPFMKEPIKSFLHRAQQKLRVYIAIENAWPRVKGDRVEKIEVPRGIIEKLAKEGKYQSPEFRKQFTQLWADDKMQDRMVKYVSKSFLRCYQSTMIQLIVLGLQGCCTASSRAQAEG